MYFFDISNSPVGCFFIGSYVMVHSSVSVRNLQYRILEIRKKEEKMIKLTNLFTQLLNDMRNDMIDFFVLARWLWNDDHHVLMAYRWRATEHRTSRQLSSGWQQTRSNRRRRNLRRRNLRRSSMYFVVVVHVLSSYWKIETKQTLLILTTLSILKYVNSKSSSVR